MSDHDKDLFRSERELLESLEKKLAEGFGETPEVRECLQRVLVGYRKILKQSETLTRLSDNQQRRLNQILERLGRYVSPQLFKKIAHGREKVELDTSKRRRLTVFISDIKAFTTTTGRMEAETLAKFLNSYLEEMTRIVLKWDGTLDKYMGDAILVFFGDPVVTSDEDHALRCVRMALEMRDRMAELQHSWYHLGYEDPLHIRMGIATGFCTVGNFGSSQRMDYTIIGNTVNMAQRLQTVAEVDEILISHDTWGLVKDQVQCEVPVSYQLKGFTHPVLAHKVLQLWETVNREPVRIEDPEKNLLIQVDWSKLTKKDLLEIIHNL